MKAKSVLKTRLIVAATVCGAVLMAQAAQSKDIWVQADYSGANGSSDGTSSRPFARIGDAWNIDPGDVVNVRDGIYREAVWLVGGSYNTSLPNNGYVTYKSVNKWGAKIIGPTNGHIGAFHYWGGNNATSLSSSDGDPSAWQKSYGGAVPNPRAYINIDGFDITSDRSDGNGVWFQWAHHIVIKNNKIHNCGGSGIGVSLSDYITIEGNTVNDNAAKTTGGYGSGISLWRTRPWDNNTGAHNIIRNNSVYHNYNNQSDSGRSDGNGIIIDTTLFDKGTVVENNVIWNNGGNGIMLDAAANVTVRFNTLYKNSWDSSLHYPEIYLQDVDWEDGDPYTDGKQFSMENGPNRNISIYANIISVLNNRLTVQINPNSQNCWTNNNLRWYDATNPSNVPDFFPSSVGVQESRGAADVVGNPGFISPSTALTANFRLNKRSIALNKIGWANTLNLRDMDGVTRPKGTSNDMGAYESY